MIFLASISNNSPDVTPNVEESESLVFDIDTTFRLPIQYLDKDKLFALNDIVAHDLELKLN